ncbi:transglycosylase domain-containing protein [Glycomyces harbinensis]|uniref:Membrane carboxypeptidase (Penicillin-binding protein) n=1 Tax=Glycomyces harbinensis TaxID=58114 RepID=A0A1G6Z6N1_9ACTN|nr:transglycosylase domain-containing protein [Glycomyces harbinensis]SDD97933.1 Membrane carboxypeptidase (penicillin-binding protein) [Glycomyces harbinensis]
MEGRETSTRTGRTLRLRRIRRNAAVGAAEVPSEQPGRKGHRRRGRRRRGRRRRMAALTAVLALLAGTAVVVGSVFYAGVDLPDELDAALSQGSTVYYSDGTTVMGELAAEQRTSVGLDEIADDLEHALVAAEDANFYSHPGIDAKGVLRALVNNLTGGSQQGASTLTQQYVGLVADIRGDGSYLRKAREAAMAMKLEEEFTKDEILNHYLNIVYFGRGAYGVEAAAQAFFGRPAADLSTSQSALLVAQIKSPDGPYDPRDPYDQGGTVEEATERWAYVLDQMVATGELDPVKRGALTELPETLDPTDDAEGLGPEGFVTNGFVLAELADAGLTTDEVLRGGFAITTTLDAELQETALDRTGLREVTADDEDMSAALAAVEPGTGRVLAYYGGEDGAGLDQADDVGHRPGTAFNVVTAVAANLAGLDLMSPVLDGSSPQYFDTYLDEDGEPKPLVNTGGASVESISFERAVVEKLDTPVYSVAEQIGGEAIAAAAAGLGVERLWDPHDLDENGVAAEIATGDAAARFHPDLGIGAYPMTVLDAASVYAALAAGGTVAEPYFVERVSGPDGLLYEAEPEIAEETIPSWAVNRAQAYLLTPANDRDELPLAVNASATWHLGSDPNLALAVWAGDERREGDGASPYNTVAEGIWWTLMKSRPDRFIADREDYEALQAEVWEDELAYEESAKPGAEDPVAEPPTEDPA